ncbi:MAG: hypothetical protein OSJ27_05910 [Candidatus Gastranaerophilales bacterium]|nr:hypothetical protein [Candidatus Gastranaerophilales bacterium]
MRNIILKSFETFIAQPLSLLKNKIIRITNLKSDFLNSNAINVSLFDDTVQIDVVNSEKAYNLLSAVVYKRKMNELRQVNINENQASTILN